MVDDLFTLFLCHLNLNSNKRPTAVTNITKQRIDVVRKIFDFKNLTLRTCVVLPWFSPQRVFYFCFFVEALKFLNNNNLLLTGQGPKNKKKFQKWETGNINLKSLRN